MRKQQPNRAVPAFPPFPPSHPFGEAEEDLEEALGDPNHVPGLEVGLVSHRIRALMPAPGDKDLGRISSGGKPTRQCHRIEHVHAAYERVFAGLIHLADDVEGPVAQDLDADARILQVALL